MTPALKLFCFSSVATRVYGGYISYTIYNIYKNVYVYIYIYICNHNQLNVYVWNNDQNVILYDCSLIHTKIYIWYIQIGWLQQRTASGEPPPTADTNISERWIPSAMAGYGGSRHITCWTCGFMGHNTMIIYPLVNCYSLRTWKYGHRPSGFTQL